MISHPQLAMSIETIPNSKVYYWATSPVSFSKLEITYTDQIGSPRALAEIVFPESMCASVLEDLS